jgi:hypothetical protein
LIERPFLQLRHRIAPRRLAQRATG